MSRYGQRVRPFVQSEFDAAREARQRGDASAEFAHLERAHVLGQADTALHVRVHCAMLVWGLRQCSLRQIAGQLLRIVGAATKTAVGLVPLGNTGGADVSPLRSMPIAPDLQRLIDAASR